MSVKHCNDTDLTLVTFIIMSVKHCNDTDLTLVTFIIMSVVYLNLRKAVALQAVLAVCKESSSFPCVKEDTDTISVCSLRCVRHLESLAALRRWCAELQSAHVRHCRMRQFVTAHFIYGLWQGAFELRDISLCSNRFPKFTLKLKTKQTFSLQPRSNLPPTNKYRSRLCTSSLHKHKDVARNCKLSKVSLPYRKAAVLYCTDCTHCNVFSVNVYPSEHMSEHKL